MELVNAQEQHELHPATFWVSSEKEPGDLLPGDLAKVCNGRERFWVIINARNGDRFIGTVDNDLVVTPKSQLKCGDAITFRSENIYDYELGSRHT